MIREAESDIEFRKKLQNPVNPINQTETSPEMQEYLDKLNSGQLRSEETQKREELRKKNEEANSKFKMFCPHCRRPSLKRTPQLSYRCSFCGLETNAPLRMAESNEKV